MSHTKSEIGWFRRGTLVYSLEETGRYRKGVPELRNRFSASVQGGPDTPQEELEANARLMQAAPALLRALEGLLASADLRTICGQPVADAVSAIRLAKGE